MKKEKLITKIILIHFVLLTFSVNAQNTEVPIGPEGNHELTVFVIRSASPLNWESPATLYNSYKKSVLTNFMKKERTLKGHFFIKLSTPLLDEPLYAGIVSANRKEEKKLMFINKIGLSVLGVSMKGAIQGRNVLEKKIAVHTKNNDIAYLKIKLSKSATQRIIDFYTVYTSDFIQDYSPSDFYGGAFWPRYENEGAGCSSFALVILDLIGINDIETDKWQKEINIPMHLIGGEINDSKKVRVRDIKRTKTWHTGNGVKNVDFVSFYIVDPSTAYYWILEQRNPEYQLQNTTLLAVQEFGIPGLFIDKSKVEIDLSEPIIQKRPDKNLFVEYHQANIAKINKK
jgi:hypothetical protein